MGRASRPFQEYMSSTLLVLIVFCSSSFLPVRSQTTPSTNAFVPPLQWINLTGLLGGSNPPPGLKGASLGYDNNNRNLLIFGGESQQGFPISQTYLLNLDTLTWGAPAPPTTLPQGGPPARSFAVSGDDSAASNRHSHIVIGGKGPDGNPLPDVWEFDYTSQFWSEVQITPGGPSPRWGAVGGIDIRTPALQDPSLPGPNNSFYLSGGFDGTESEPISDLWRLNISGILTSNNDNAVVGSWQQIPITNTLPGKTGVAGTVVRESSDTQQRVVTLGGCTTSLIANASCLDGQDYIVNADARSDSMPPLCPAPRLLPAVAQNLNPGSKTFSSQVFMLLGTFNSSQWDDAGGLKNGEVAVLDLDTRGWARVLPAGDPGAAPGGQPAFPSPRSGAAVLSWTEGLVGNNRATLSDIIVFGGEDESGIYLADVWILRAYNTTPSGPLVGGVNANGAGVVNTMMQKCATRLGGATSSGSPTPSPTGPSDANPSSPVSNVPEQIFDTSVVHKALAPISVAMLLPAIVAFRLSTPSSVAPASFDHRMGLYYLSLVISLAAFGVGIGGLASAFTSITSTTTMLAKRSSSAMNLTTTHSKAGLALFAGMFGIVPILLIASAWSMRDSDGSTIRGRYRANSGELVEKAGLYPGRIGSPQPTTNGMSDELTPEEPRQRARSWNTLSPWPANRSARRSSESGLDAVSSPSTVRSFEVTNRPTRARHASAHSLAAFADTRPSHATRNLSDMSWLERRRSLNTVGDLDYALAQLPRRTDMPPTPGTAALDIQSTQGLMHPPLRLQAPRMPSLLSLLVHFLLHAFLLGLSILSLVALWTHASKGAFAVFLVWVVIYYAIIFYLAFRGVPQESFLSAFFNRISTDPIPALPTPAPSRPLSDIGIESVPFPSGPYSHQPPFRVAHDSEYPLSSGGHGSVEEDDELDEDTRQRNIEEEMSRRDVSIVTVPKRKLFLTNPETS